MAEDWHWIWLWVRLRRLRVLAPCCTTARASPAEYAAVSHPPNPRHLSPDRRHPSATQPSDRSESANVSCDKNTILETTSSDMANSLRAGVNPPAANLSTAAGSDQKDSAQDQKTVQSSANAKVTNGDSKPKGQQQKAKEVSTDGASETLSPAELKKKAKAEKAARRAREKMEREQAVTGANAGTQQPGQGVQASQSTRKGQAVGKDAAGPSQKGPRRAAAQPGATTTATTETKKKEDKNVAVFGHLYGIPRRSTIAGAGKEVHPAVLALGLQMRDYVICGSSARCVATLVAFKRVSQSGLSDVYCGSHPCIFD
jgi:translation initiation factor eIF-2B subunit delta